MRAQVVKVILAVLALGIFFLISVSSSRADSVSFDLTANNLGIAGSVGTITVTVTGTDQVTVKIMMNSGFSLKLNGGDIALSGFSGLSSGTRLASQPLLELAHSPH